LNSRKGDIAISRALMAVVPNPSLGLNSFSALCKTGFPADSPQTSQSAKKARTLKPIAEAKIIEVIATHILPSSPYFVGKLGR
jgi:hypothetical protein